MSLLSFSP